MKKHLVTNKSKFISWFIKLERTRVLIYAIAKKQSNASKTKLFTSCRSRFHHACGDDFGWLLQDANIFAYRPLFCADLGSVKCQNAGI